MTMTMFPRPATISTNSTAINAASGTHIEDIYNSCKTTIISAIDLLQTNPSFNGQSQSHICHRRSLLSFLGDALRWLVGTAATKDTYSIKTQMN